MDNIKILLVEDEAIVAMDIKNRLENHAYTVLAIAHTGEDAIRLATEMCPDLAIMDINLGAGIGGIEAAEQIQKRIDIPIVYLTAYADEKTLSRAKVTKPYGYILKPFEDRELHCNIEIAIYNHHLEKKLRESQLFRMQRMESIETLASGVAHDINNRFTSIMLSQELLQEKLTDEESKRLLNIIKRSTQRGADLMKQVMSFAKGVEGERMVFQVSGIISENAKIAKKTFPANIEIKTDIPKDLWHISGDATQLNQVIMNLCMNARDAMSNGGILRISAENHVINEDYTRINIEAKAGSCVVITVSDTGAGIPPDILDRIFEPFFTTKELGKGTGLGLSTALGIVRSHGGFIDVYSEVGKGTAFKVYLPAVTAPETLKVQECQYELPAGHGELILLVDDEDQIREITQITLEKHGYKVITANDGKEAVALYSRHREKIRLVLMDMMMPVMDGQASIRELRKANPEVKVIAVSGLTEKGKIAKTDDALAFLMKPYSAEKLLNTIHEVITTK